jgi:DNA-binding NarL/FixJ family response regulator
LVARISHRTSGGDRVIRVLMADDHAGVRDGLARLLRAIVDVELVGIADNGGDALQRCLQTAPDVVLMDLKMPRMDGVEATRRIIAERPGTAVLVLTACAVQHRVAAALEAGACGYLLKDASAADVAEGIRAAASGRLPCAHLCPRHG